MASNIDLLSGKYSYFYAKGFAHVLLKGFIPLKPPCSCIKHIGSETSSSKAFIYSQPLSFAKHLFEWVLLDFQNITIRGIENYLE